MNFLVVQEKETKTDPIELLFKIHLEERNMGFFNQNYYYYHYCLFHGPLTPFIMKETTSSLK